MPLSLDVVQTKVQVIWDWPIRLYRILNEVLMYSKGNKADKKKNSSAAAKEEEDMAATNSTADEKLNKLLEIYCSAAFAEEIHNQLRCLSVIDIFLSITAFLGNTLILVALHKESSLNPPSKLLLRSLAATDLCVGLISEPLHAMFKLSLVSERWNACVFAAYASTTTGFTFSGVTLLTMTAMSVDRLLALLLGLRYKHVVTLKRMRVVVIAFWLVSIAVVAVQLWNVAALRWYSYLIIPLCLATSAFCYIKIFRTLTHLRQQTSTRPAKQLDVARYKNAVSSSLWLQSTLVICYLPFAVVNIVVTVSTNSSQSAMPSSLFVVRLFAIVLTHLNSSLNPILYCWKIRPVRQAVKVTIRQVLCHLSS